MMVGDLRLRLSRQRTFRLLATFAGLALVFAAADQARASMITKTLTFDDIGNPGNVTVQVPENYGGLTWANDAISGFHYFDGDNLGFPTPNGYINGTVSDPYVALTKKGTASTVSSGSSGSFFDFNSAQLTSAWTNNLNVLVQGYRGGISIFSETIQVDVTAPTLYSPTEFVGIDSLTFTPSGGTTAPGYLSYGPRLVMDDFTFTTAAVPEPSSMILLGTGLMGLMGYGARRRKRRLTECAA